MILLLILLFIFVIATSYGNNPEDYTVYDIFPEDYLKKVHKKINNDISRENSIDEAI